MPAQTGYADVNGTRLYYETSGSGRPLLLIHGHTLDSRMWNDQFEPFSEHFRVVRCDLRGYGRSASLTGEPYAHTDDLASLLDLLAIPVAAIVGHSMGGAIAIDFALAHPQRVDALIPVAPALNGYHFPLELSQAFNDVSETAREQGIDAAKRLWLSHPWFAPALENPAVAARLTQMVDEFSGWHFVNENTDHAQEPPAAQRLGKITTPTLVVIGERDLPHYNHPVADLLHTRIPDAQKSVIPHAGHLPNMEDPAAFNTAVLRFLQTLP